VTFEIPMDFPSTIMAAPSGTVIKATGTDLTTSGLFSGSTGAATWTTGAGGKAARGFFSSALMPNPDAVRARMIAPAAAILARDICRGAFFGT